MTSGGTGGDLGDAGQAFCVSVTHSFVLPEVLLRERNDELLEYSALIRGVHPKTPVDSAGGRLA